MSDTGKKYSYFERNCQVKGFICTARIEKSGLMFFVLQVCVRQLYSHRYILYSSLMILFEVILISYNFCSVPLFFGVCSQYSQVFSTLTQTIFWMLTCFRILLNYCMHISGCSNKWILSRVNSYTLPNLPSQEKPGWEYLV